MSDQEGNSEDFLGCAQHPSTETIHMFIFYSQCHPVFPHMWNIGDGNPSDASKSPMSLNLHVYRFNLAGTQPLKIGALGSIRVNFPLYRKILC